jgi:hypothetical protein
MLSGARSLLRPGGGGDAQDEALVVDEAARRSAVHVGLGVDITSAVLLPRPAPGG